MKPSMTPRHFLVDTDLTQQEQSEVLELALALKADRWAHRPYAGPQTVAVVFDKTSTRTRASFSAGIADLGGNPLMINPGESQLGKESVADTARVFSRMVSTIVWRTYAQAGLEEMAAVSDVPVVNGLSDDYHPCQILADLLTVREHRAVSPGSASPTSGTPPTTWPTPTCWAGPPPACTCASPARRATSPTRRWCGPPRSARSRPEDPCA